MLRKNNKFKRSPLYSRDKLLPPTILVDAAFYLTGSEEIDPMDGDTWFANTAPNGMIIAISLIGTEFPTFPFLVCPITRRGWSFYENDFVFYSYKFNFVLSPLPDGARYCKVSALEMEYNALMELARKNHGALI